MRLFLVFSALTHVWGQYCQAPCNCNDGGIVQCDFKGLNRSPTAFPSNMTNLNLDHNYLTKFSTSALKSNSLKVLSMRNNSITVFIDTERKRFPNLEKLDLSMNKLRWISMGLFQRMKNLQELDLSHNKIISVASFRIPLFVWKLDASFNAITELPDHNFLKTAKNLMELDLSHNEISEIKGRTFESLAHLGILNLDGNKIQELRNYAFDGLKSCYRINLRDNMINEVRSKAFSNVGTQIRGGEVAPKIIDLRNNQLSIILKDWLDAFRGDKADCEKTFSCPEAFKVLLRSNPIYCDCNMQQVRDTHGKYFGDLDESFCVNPELEGTSIEKFHDEICCQAQI